MVNVLMDNGVLVGLREIVDIFRDPLRFEEFVCYPIFNPIGNQNVAQSPASTYMHPDPVILLRSDIHHREIKSARDDPMLRFFDPLRSGTLRWSTARLFHLDTVIYI
jgi:hypothetical protein